MKNRRADMKIMESSRAEMKNRNEKQEGRDKKQEWKAEMEKRIEK
jgi:hypothetical protein